MSQEIDSVIHKPFPNVDSIEYWHKKEIIENKEYLTNGYNQYCFCEYHNFLEEANHRSTNKIVTSEGFIRNEIKNGKWTYWNPAEGICCDEFHLYPDSIVIYQDGIRIEKEDNFGHYIYSNGKIRIEISSRSYNVAIECEQDSCEIIINDKYLLKRIEIDHLESEMGRIVAGEYDFEAKKIIIDFKKYQENMKNNR